MMKTIKILILLSVVFAGSGLSAHRIKLFAAEENGLIKGYGYAGSRRIVNSPVTVYRNGQIVTTLTTDAEGEFVFTPPENSGSYRLVVDTGDGHLAEYTVELAAVTPSPAVPPDKRKTAEPGIKTSAVPAAQQDIARQLFALQCKLDEVENKIRLHDILGGIGYILGIAGIFFYFSARKQGQ